MVLPSAGSADRAWTGNQMARAKANARLERMTRFVFVWFFMFYCFLFCCLLFFALDVLADGYLRNRFHRDLLLLVVLRLDFLDLVFGGFLFFGGGHGQHFIDHSLFADAAIVRQKLNDLFGFLLGDVGARLAPHAIDDAFPFVGQRVVVGVDGVVEVVALRTLLCEQWVAVLPGLGIGGNVNRGRSVLHLGAARFGRFMVMF